MTKFMLLKSDLLIVQDKNKINLIVYGIQKCMDLVHDTELSGYANRLLMT
jgi:hypothetical protein